MQRRQMMTLAALAAVAAQAGAQSAETGAAPHHHHDAVNPFAALSDTTGHCVAAGQACLSHCLMLLGMGDTSMADCARTVNQMLALCSSLQALAAQGSKLVPSLAKVALEACNQCLEACKPHAQEHAPCKACMDACAECARQCKLVAA